MSKAAAEKWNRKKNIENTNRVNMRFHKTKYVFSISVETAKL